MILDDALSAVDAKTEREIISHLQERAWRRNMNITSAHRLSAIRHADEIIVMNEGHVWARYPRELLAQRGWYYEQYLIQRDRGGDRMKTLEAIIKLLRYEKKEFWLDSSACWFQPLRL